MPNLDEYNPWWYTGSVPKHLLKEYKREPYYQAERLLNKKEIIILTGLRRVGKTTIMYQLIDRLLQNGVDPKNVLYYSFDMGNERIADVIREFTDTVAKSGKKYAFLDEIQWAENWAADLKRIFDLNADTKIVASGSASVVVESNAIKFLAGRYYPLYVPTLRFREFCEMKGIKPEPWMEAKLSGMFKEFLAKSGFPGWVNEDPEYTKRILREIVLDRIVLADIPRLRRFREINALTRLVEYITENSGFLAVLDELSSIIGVSKPTTSEMLKYLEKTYLIRILRNYGSPETAARTHRKIYVSDHGLYFGSDSGKRLETLIVAQLNAETFFRRGGKEVDTVWNDLAIEVKTNMPSPRQVRNLLWFAKKYGKQPVVVTVEDEGSVSDVPVVPAWKFLLFGDKELSSNHTTKKV